MSDIAVRLASSSLSGFAMPEIVRTFHDAYRCTSSRSNVVWSMRPNIGMNGSTSPGWRPSRSIWFAYRTAGHTPTPWVLRST